MDKPIYSNSAPPPPAKLSPGDQSLRERELAELSEMKARLEEANGVLEVRINAKTRALRELAANLEKEMKERTEELRRKVAESENSRVALMNMLEDMEDLRRRAEEEREKTMAIIANFLAEGHSPATESTVIFTCKDLAGQPARPDLNLPYLL